MSGLFYFLFSVSHFNTSIHSSKSHKLFLTQKPTFPYSVSRTAIFRELRGLLLSVKFDNKNDLLLVSESRVRRNVVCTRIAHRIIDNT